MLFDAERAAAGLRARWRICERRTSEAVDEGYTILILSDRGVNMKLAPIPSLLATAGVHHHLVREGTRIARRSSSRRAKRAKCIIWRC